MEIVRIYTHIGKKFPFNYVARSPMVEAQKSRETDGINSVWCSMKNNKTLLHAQGHRDVPGGIEAQVFVQNSSLCISTDDGYIKGFVPPPFWLCKHSLLLVDAQLLMSPKEIRRSHRFNTVVTIYSFQQHQGSGWRSHLRGTHTLPNQWFSMVMR